MKKLVLILFLLSSVLGYCEKVKFNSTENGAYELTLDKTGDNSCIITFKLNELSVNQDLECQNCMYMSINGFGMTHTAGEPSLPFYSFKLQVPTWNQCNIQIMDSSIIEYNYELSPAREIEEPFAKSKNSIKPITQFDGFFYQNPLMASHITNFRDLPIHYFSVSPIDYNCKEKKVRVYKSFKAKITYNYEENEVFNNRSTAFRNTAFLSIDSTLCLEKNNAVKLNLYEEITPDYLILTTSDLDTIDVNRFVEWKRTKGFITHVVSRDDWSMTSVMDTVMSYYYNPNINLQYLLITQPHEKIPGQEILYTIDANGEIGYSDYYYSIAGAYERDLPWIYCGRFGALTAEEFKQCVDKIIDYQKDPITDEKFYENAFVCGSFDYDENDKSDNSKEYEYYRLIRTCEEYRAYLNDFGVNVNRIYSKMDGAVPKYWSRSPVFNMTYYKPTPIGSDLQYPAFKWNGTKQDVISNINNGCFLGIYNSHGSYDYWCANGFDVADFKYLNNGRYQPVIFSLACLTGSFHTYRGDNNSLSFANVLSKKPNGAIAVVAGSAVTYTPLNDVFGAGMIDALWPNPGFKLDSVL